MRVQGESLTRQFNIIIVPNNGEATTTFNLSGAMLKWATSLLIMILFFLLSSTCFFYNKYTYVSRQLAISQKVPAVSMISKSLALGAEREEEVNKKIHQEKRPLKKEWLANQRLTENAETKDKEVYLIPGEKYKEITLDGKMKLREEKVKEANLYIPSFKPCEGVVTSNFGDRNDPFDRMSRETHKGIDVANVIGTPIYAAAKGIVVEAGYLNGYGYVVYIDHGNGIETRYAHNSKLYVEKGEEIEKGEQIAEMGSTGNSTGSHLHFEIRENEIPVSPKHLFYEGE